MLGAGFVVALLCAYVARVVWQVENLTGQAEHAVVEAVEVARNANRVHRNAQTQVHIARRYEVLRDRDLLTKYLRRQVRLTRLLDQVLVQDRSAPTAALVAILHHELRGLRALLTVNPSSPLDVGLSPVIHNAGLRNGFSRVGELTALLRQQANRDLNERLSKLRQHADAIRNELFFHSFIVLPLLAVVVVALAVRILRPVADLRVALRSLGQGAAPPSEISINGPSELKSLGRDLELLRLRLAYLEVHKRRFVQQLSHELTAPLTGILDGTALLLDGGAGRLDAHQRQIIRGAHLRCVELQRQLDGLVHMTAAVDCRSGVSREQLSCHSLLESVLRQHQVEIERKRLDVRLVVDEFAVQVDAEKIRTAIDNLVSNAIKFSPIRCVVDITADVTRENLTIDVADQGPGIDAADKNRIFEPFYRGKRSIAHGLGGAGVGLAVALACMELHQGDIKLTRTTSTGTTFRLSLPLTPG